MIKLSFITDLHKAFPNATVSEPFMNASYLFDKDRNMMGHLDYGHEELYLNEKYEFLKEAKYVLNKHGIKYALKEYAPEELLYTD